MRVSLVDLSQKKLERIASSRSRTSTSLQQSCVAINMQQQEAMPFKSLLNESSWSREDKALINWFLSAARLPEAPFNLNAAVKVVDQQKYYASLRKDIELGPRGPRVRYGALQRELQFLKGLVEAKRGR